MRSYINQNNWKKQNVYKNHTIYHTILCNNKKERSIIFHNDSVWWTLPSLKQQFSENYKTKI